MIQPNEHLKKLTFEVRVSDITIRAKLEIRQAVSTDDRPVCNEHVQYKPYWN